MKGNKMKRTVLAAALAVILVMLAVSVTANDVAPEFTKAFFPNGDIGKPTDIYYEIKRNDEGKAIYVYMWLTQPDDMVAMFTKMNEINDYNEWNEKYNCSLDNYYLQIDCKVDNGNWHYMKEWNVGEYPQDDQPYDLAIRQVIWASSEQKTYREGGALIDPWYCQDKENAGYLEPVIKMDGDTPYLDLENHSLTLRARYFIKYRNDGLSDSELEANGGSNTSYLLSDWSDEIKIGKGGTQKEITRPEKIEAPSLCALEFYESVKEDDSPVRTYWKVLVDFPRSAGEAVKYYAINEDYYDALYSVMQYRSCVNGEWSEWKNTDWGNPEWIFSGWKIFETEGIDKNDKIEFRTYLENRADESMNSDYSNSVFCEAGEIRVENSDIGIAAIGGAEKPKCKVCGICPIQPLGICLFIWLAIILVVIVVVIIIASKSGKDEKQKKRGRN